MAEIMSFAKKNNLSVIEDCAQAPDAKYKGKTLGTIGDWNFFISRIKKHDDRRGRNACN